jgi:hypothetical protein
MFDWAPNFSVETDSRCCATLDECQYVTPVLPNTNLLQYLKYVLPSYVVKRFSDVQLDEEHGVFE